MSRDMSEKDICNMHNGQFKAMIIMILTGLEKRMEEFPFFQ